MKNLSKLIFLIGLAILIGTATTSCKKDLDEDNNTPTWDPTPSPSPIGYLPGDSDVPAPEAHVVYTLHASLTVDFENKSSNATSWVWNFGDGTTSSTNNPSHTYATKGSYYVTLKAKNSGSIVSTAYVTIGLYVNFEIQNTTSDPYYIYIDDVDMGVLNGGTTYTYENYEPGNHKIYVKQKSGYVFYATTHTWNIEAIAGYTYPRIID